MRNASACELELGRVARLSITSAYCVLCVFGTALNLLVIYLVVTFKKLRTASNAFIVNGCAADLLVCAVWMPHEAAALSGAGAAGSRAFREALLSAGITVSLLSHSLIALNRYVLITKTPAAYHSLYHKRHAEWMIAASWLLAGLGSLLPWLSGARTPAAAAAAGARWCGESVLSGPLPAGALALTILTQTGVVLYCYFKIFRRVQISVKRVSILNFQIVNNLPYAFPRRDKRLGFYVLAVCCVFLLSTQPVLWTLTAGLFVPVSGAVRAACWMLFCTLFVSNPFLYTWKNEEFRRSLRSVMRVEPAAVSSVSCGLQRHNSRRTFLGEMS